MVLVEYLGLFLNDIKYAVLQGLLVFTQSVLLPREVEDLGVQIVAGQALFEEPDDVLVVRILLEFELPTVLHELLELDRVPLAKLFQRGFYLFLFDVIVFVVFVPAWEALPRERPAQEVEQDVSNGLQIVPPRLLDALVSVNRCIAGGAR